MSTVLSSRYELGAIIGAGGSAQVREGRDVLLDRRVAVKLLDARAIDAADPAGHARFLREARSSARFTHPNAVAVYDAGEDDGSLFLVMELVEGGTLAQLIADSAPLADNEVTRLGGQILDALGAAHAVGLVHRDVKPANVLLDRAGNVKLADFGIAKRFDELSDHLTTDGLVVGTRSYLAPEQAAGEEAGPATDLYAVGVVLYEMATGTRPTPISVRAATAADARLLRPDLSPAIATTVMRAMAADPRQRYASAADMAVALRAPASGSNDTAVMDAPYAMTSAMAPDVAGGYDARGARRWWVAVALAVAVPAAGIAAYSAGRGDDTADRIAPATAPVTVPTDLAPATLPVVDLTAAPPSDTAPPTSPPVTSPASGPVIPEDLSAFVELLRSNPEATGASSAELADQLEKLADGSDRPRGGEQRLRRDIDKWVDQGSLDPAIAAAAITYLDS